MKLPAFVFFALLVVISCVQEQIPGPQGLQGPPGAPANSVSVVQFCPAQGATTYGHFPEYGLCIDNVLYGVYWDNKNAFLAEIVPGTYKSTSTGLGCTFVVASGCLIK